jgi:hypothetical protein
LCYTDDVKEKKAHEKSRPENKGTNISQIIAASIDAGKIKLADPPQTSTRYRSYTPFWA